MADIFYATHTDHRRIIELSDQAFGVNYLNENHFESHERFLVALVHHRIVGFASCVVSKGVGNVNSVVVDPDYKRQGIGSQLVHNCLLHLWGLGVRRVESQAWERSDNGIVGLRSPLLTNGFEEYGYDEDFYANDGESGAICIICGKDCKCGAFLFKLEMSNSHPPEKPK